MLEVIECIVKNKTIIILVLIYIVVFVISFFKGRYDATISETIRAIFGQGDTILANIILRTRLPRILIASLCGVALSLDGVVFQAILRNPLASSQVIGVTSGASFGAAFAIVVFSGSIIYIQLISFSFGIIAVLLSLLLSSFIKNKSDLSLVLSGLIVTAFFSALLSIFILISEPHTQTPTIVFWLMGSFNRVSMTNILHLLLPFGLAIIFCMSTAWKMNVLTLGDDHAKNLGVDIKKYKIIYIIFVTFFTSCIIALCGAIGWVGLFIPHVCRIFVGNDHRKLIPNSIVLGATCMVILDTLARSLFQMEIPIGILVSLFGAPLFFVAFIINNKKFKIGSLRGKNEN